MSPSRKYSLVAIVLSAVMSLQVSAHNHAGEKPTKDPVNVVAMTLPESCQRVEDRSVQFAGSDSSLSPPHRDH